MLHTWRIRDYDPGFYMELTKINVAKKTPTFPISLSLSFNVGFIRNGDSDANTYIQGRIQDWSEGGGVQKLQM